jgi:hypothetical protein
MNCIKIKAVQDMVVVIIFLLHLEVLMIFICIQIAIIINQAHHLLETHMTLSHFNMVQLKLKIIWLDLIILLF